MHRFHEKYKLIQRKYLSVVIQKWIIVASVKSLITGFPLIDINKGHHCTQFKTTQEIPWFNLLQNVNIFPFYIKAHAAITYPKMVNMFSINWNFLE